MYNRILRTALPGLVLALPLLTPAAAHEIVGNRFFPATLTIDDPGVNDEAALPTISTFKNEDVPSIRQLDISGEYSKRITDDFGIAVAPTWTRLSAPGGPHGTGASGFQNLETAFKYRFYKDAAHELIMSVGLGIEWAHTGSKDVGAEPFTNFEPTFFFGKGFGDLPDSARWLRPFPVDTLYGRILIAKICLVLAMVGLAIINRGFMAPKIGTSAAIDGPGPAAALWKSVAAEQSLGIFVLVIVSVLGVLPPPH
jgi:hypothetical protein